MCGSATMMLPLMVIEEETIDLTFDFHMPPKYNCLFVYLNEASKDMGKARGEWNRAPTVFPGSASLETLGLPR